LVLIIIEMRVAFSAIVESWVFDKVFNILCPERAAVVRAVAYKDPRFHFIARRATVLVKCFKRITVLPNTES